MICLLKAKNNFRSRKYYTRKDFRVGNYYSNRHNDYYYYKTDSHTSRRKKFLKKQSNILLRKNKNIDYSGGDYKKYYDLNWILF